MSSVLASVFAAMMFVTPVPGPEINPSKQIANLKSKTMKVRYRAELAERAEQRQAAIAAQQQETEAQQVESSSTVTADVASWQDTVNCECSGSWDCPQGTTYLWGLQFHPDTWSSHGGNEFAVPYSGDIPTPSEQVTIAWRVLASHQSDPWPNCPDPGD